MEKFMFWMAPTTIATTTTPTTFSTIYDDDDDNDDDDEDNIEVDDYFDYPCHCYCCNCYVFGLLLITPHIAAKSSTTVIPTATSTSPANTLIVSATPNAYAVASHLHPPLPS